MKTPRLKTSSHLITLQLGSEGSEGSEAGAPVPAKTTSAGREPPSLTSLEALRNP
jgi:hypothetical protein